MINCSHDELLAEASEKIAEQVRRIVEECMIEAFIETFPGAPHNGVAAAGIGASWYAAKP
jgi:DNA polymerase I-like protein with 3'-5' exonuclease and polymerase domains